MTPIKYCKQKNTRILKKGNNIILRKKYVYKAAIIQYQTIEYTTIEINNKTTNMIDSFIGLY